MLRLLDGNRIGDRRSIGDMLEKFVKLSINQITAEIKFLEAWKANKDRDYPVHLKKERKVEGKEPARKTRAHNREEIVE